MRLFLGIDLPVDQKESLFNQLDPLMKKYASFNWVDKKLYHATLQFFGEVSDMDYLDEAIQKATYDKKSFFLYGLKLDFFSTFQLVLHVQYRREKTIDTIVTDLEQHMPSVQKQRTFIFHTTIARTRIPSKQQYFHLRKQLRQMAVDLSFPVQTLTLFASTKSQGQRTYHSLKQYPLLT